MPPERANRGRPRTLGAAAALVLAAFLLPSCGEDSSNAELSRERAQNLRSTLDQVEDRIASSDCTGATQQAGTFKQEVTDLPARVDSDLRDALAGSASRLESLVAEQCREETAPAQDTTTEPPPADENTGDQGATGEQGKKPKKPKKPKDTEPPPDDGSAGQEGSTGVTGPDGGASIPPEE
jgi:hypothetical protein